MLSVLKRELKSYFSTPTGYIFLGVFLLISGFFFSYGNIFARSSYFNNFLSNILFIFLFVVPLLTMRLISEDKKNRTDQLLLTSPIRISEIVIGKFLAAAVIFGIALVVTMSYAALIAVFGDLKFSEVACGYLGFFLIGCSFIAIGLFISSTTENQLIAAVITLVTLIFIWLLDPIQNMVPKTPVSGIVFAGLLTVVFEIFMIVILRNLLVSVPLVLIPIGIIIGFYVKNKEAFQNLFVNVLSWFSLLKRNVSFSSGILKLEDIVYYLSFIGAFLFLTVRLIEKKRWS